MRTLKTESIVLTAEREVEIREIDIPEIKDNQILIESVANGICMFEISLFTGTEKLRYPWSLGHEGVGRAIRCGKNVKTVKEGDYVNCSTWARHQIRDEDVVFAFKNPPRDPATALVEPVSCIASALPAYNITSGDRVLLLGAGYMGLLNVIGLAHTPISELVVTDIKQKNLELARSFGATHTINTGTEEGRAEMRELKPFDLVVECAGIQETVDEGTRLTRQGGRLSIFSWHHQPRSVPLGAWHIKGLTVTNVGPAISSDLRINFMERAVRLIDCGMFDQSDLITHRHSWKDAQKSMELAAERRDDYIKGVFLFD